jgi:hypothetical protein
VISRAALAAATLVCAAASPTLAAQVSTSMDAGVIGARYADGSPQSGAIFAPALRLQQSHASLDATGSLASIGQGTSSVQWFVGGSAFTPARSLRGTNVAAELAAGVDGYTADGFRVGQQVGTARAHIYESDGGLWLEGGAGRAQRPDADGNLLLGGLGAWWHAGSALVTLSLAHTRYDFRGPDVPLTRDAFTDVGAALQWTAQQVDIDVGAGARTATRESAFSGWGTAALAVWVTRHAALVGAVTQAPEDPTRGLLSGTSISFGLRVGMRATRHRMLPREHLADIRPFVLEPSGARAHYMSLDLPLAHHVEVMADFTDWQPRILTTADGRSWRLLLPTAPGTYHLVIRVDDGDWQPPPGVPVAADEFQGTVGVIVVK